jgi:hypothetical protein
MSRHRNGGQSRNIKVADRSFENEEKFRYLGKTVKKSKCEPWGNYDKIKFG